MKRFTIKHDNVKIHMDNEKEVKEYIENFGRKSLIVYKHTVVYERTPVTIKVDRL